MTTTKKKMLRTLSSRTNLDKDMELLRRYSNRYLPQTQSGGSYRAGQVSNFATTSPYNNYVRPAMTNSYSGNMTSGASNSSMPNTNKIGMVSTTPGRVQYGASVNQLDNGMTMQPLNNWDPISSNSNLEMSDTMRMVDSMQSRANEQMSLLSKMEELALQNAAFGKHENADKWTTLEVCYWLNSIHFHKYVPNFSSLSIDGSILLHDLDENMLTTELGIKKTFI